MDDQEDVPLLPSSSPTNPVPDQTNLSKQASPAMGEPDHESGPSFPFPTFTLSRPDARKRRIPQCIAHRGYKAAHPENTMSAFRGAVAIGAQAIETDLHLTKDDVVVISHDPSLKRCFGIDVKLADLTWDEVCKARTLQEPHEPMPRLSDLLAFLAQPENSEIWLLLDIKIDNPPAKLMSLIASTIASVSRPADSPSWTSRILLGIWAAKYLPLALKHLPGFPVTHIGFALSYARHFFDVPNVGFNMFLPMLIAPGGKKFIREAREDEGRPVLAWTVNSREGMQWCLRRGLDGVITDDPGMFLGVCEGFSREMEGGGGSVRGGVLGGGGLLPVGVKEYWRCLRVWVWVQVLVWLPGTRRRLLPVASRQLVDSIMGEEKEA